MRPWLTIDTPDDRHSVQGQPWLNLTSELTNGRWAPRRQPQFFGDTNADRFVNSGDALQTRQLSGQMTNLANVRSDVNTDGFINMGDALLARNQSGTALTP